MRSGQGLVVTSVHAPESAFEATADNVQRAVQNMPYRASLTATPPRRSGSSTAGPCPADRTAAAVV